MNKFKINLEKETFYINNSNSVIGIICFSIDDWFFPSKRWDDFVVILLAWLTKQVVALAFNKEKIIEMDFMEGDFKISIKNSSQNLCTVHFIEGEKLAGDEEIIHKTITVPFEDVKNEVRKACEVLLHMKETKELDFEEDYEKLKESYELLCKC